MKSRSRVVTIAGLAIAVLALVVSSISLARRRRSSQTNTSRTSELESGSARTDTTPTVATPTAVTPTVQATESPALFDPRNTWVFVIGVLNWQDTDLGTFPTAGRQDEELAHQFERMGVPSARVVFLADREATLSNIRNRLPGFLSQATPSSTLVFYFAGHGVRTGGHLVLTNFDIDSHRAEQTGFTMAELSRMLHQNWHGNRALFLGDSCHSGGLSEVVDSLESEQRGVHAAAITSADLHMLSTGRWTFTESVIRVLRGEPVVDSDSDGRIEFSEADDFVQRTMRFREHQITHGYRGRNFESDFVFSQRAGEPVHVPTGLPYRVGDYAQSQWQGRWYTVEIIDAQPNRVLITYPGYSRSWDEWVGADRLRAPPIQQYPVGTKVSVLWEKKWYPATVLRVDYDFHRIHYDGFGEEWDEIVTPDRIRAVQ